MKGDGQWEVGFSATYQLVPMEQLPFQAICVEQSGPLKAGGRADAVKGFAFDTPRLLEKQEGPKVTKSQTLQLTPPTD